MEIQKEIESLKIALKAWERDFLQSNGRKPNKDDIRNADSSIQGKLSFFVEKCPKMASNLENYGRYSSLKGRPTLKENNPTKSSEYNPLNAWDSSLCSPKIPQNLAAKCAKKSLIGEKISWEKCQKLQAECEEDSQTTATGSSLSPAVSSQRVLSAAKMQLTRGMSTPLVAKKQLQEIDQDECDGVLPLFSKFSKWAGPPSAELGPEPTESLSPLVPTHSIRRRSSLYSKAVFQEETAIELKEIEPSRVFKLNRSVTEPSEPFKPVKPPPKPKKISRPASSPAKEEADQCDSASASASLPPSEETPNPEPDSEASPPTKASLKRKASEADHPKKKQRKEPAESQPKNWASHCNFVKINLKKKTFVRGKKNTNFRKFKFRKWKKLQKDKGDGCFLCGQKGHWANKCPFKEGAEQNGEGEEGTPGEEMDVAAVAKESHVSVTGDQLKAKAPDEQSLGPAPCYSSNVEEIEDALRESLDRLGHPAYRQGQEAAMRRILKGQSALVLMPTGGGKSLCYQLPAYLYHEKLKSVALVISPLVSLMEDQIKRLPSFLRGACFHSGMSPAQRERVLRDVADGNTCCLLVAPETLLGGRLFDRDIPLPPISFACIDEVHCISQWSHNFRPSYMRLCKILRERFHVRTFLGLTATATKKTIEGIAAHLGVDSDGVIQSGLVPDNLHLSVSPEESKDLALIDLLRREPFASFNSIIIYCTRRDDTERVACLIRTSLQDVKKKGTLCWTADAYHAGLPSSQRSRIQKQFMTGRLRVVVATVAFGMGLDKADVRAVLHYNVPGSFESYVQEIGRGGRDGKPCNCHVFLDKAGGDLLEHQRHVFTDYVDRRVLKSLLVKLFRYIKDSQSSRSDGDASLAVAIPISTLIADLDLKEEGIETLLSYLELENPDCLQLKPHTFSTCVVKCYKGMGYLKEIAKKVEPLSISLSRCKSDPEFTLTKNALQFPIVRLSAMMNWDSGMVKKAMKRLEWTMNQKDEFTGKSGILVEFTDLSFSLRFSRLPTDEEQDGMLDFLDRRVSQKCGDALNNLHLLYRTLRSAASGSIFDSLTHVVNEKAQLRQKVIDYFQEEEHESVYSFPGDFSNIPQEDEQQLRRDIGYMLSTHSDQQFTGLSIARIFHGIGSPNFPAEVWGKERRAWRRHLGKDFLFIKKVATEEIYNFR